MQTAMGLKMALPQSGTERLMAGSGRNSSWGTARQAGSKSILPAVEAGEGCARQARSGLHSQPWRGQALPPEGLSWSACSGLEASGSPTAGRRPRRPASHRRWPRPGPAPGWARQSRTWRRGRGSGDRPLGARAQTRVRPILAPLCNTACKPRGLAGQPWWFGRAKAKLPGCASKNWQLSPTGRHPLPPGVEHDVQHLKAVLPHRHLQMQLPEHAAAVYPVLNLQARVALLTRLRVPYVHVGVAVPLALGVDRVNEVPAVVLQAGVCQWRVALGSHCTTAA